MRLLDYWRTLTSNDQRRPRECGYGKNSGASENCEIVLAPGRGVMYGYTVFCTEDHADLSQAEQLL